VVTKNSIPLKLVYSFIPTKVNFLIFIFKFQATIAHTIGVLIIFGFYFENWKSQDIRYVFGFCTTIPLITEIIAYVDVFVFKKMF
jgi:hypothetical protein